MGIPSADRSASGPVCLDAAYLELALRHELPLATLDRDLRFKAKTLGVKVIG
ncbi:hypothetical protein LptCag_2525 [Leptospirillum ferriphilum]|uniref:PIN domain-containing protein n=2 Tax=Leptospirillum TaxID=179 RepID=A0A094YPD6_9BACT|nr:MAG: Conserved hypothetical protein [Leptospirillum sp. Group II '5-way CG']EIJ77069.1 MAG: hypothetical protein C75L2_00030066 [Leptospirillum sp. Group II 'C75']KGA95091.1 hypothetical protein LptCag_2525 [Leptospirillum ferriphilum]